MCTKFGVHSSSRLPFRAQRNTQTDRQTDRQMQLNALPTPAAIQPAWIINKETRRCQQLAVPMFVAALDLAVPRCRTSFFYLNGSQLHNDKAQAAQLIAVYM